MSFLALNGYYGQPVLSLYIYLIFLYDVNQCRVQLGTNKVVVLVVVVPASIHCYCWFSHDVTKIQTKKLLILARFYFHDALEQLKTNFHTNFRFKGVLGFMIEYA